LGNVVATPLDEDATVRSGCGDTLGRDHFGAVIAPYGDERYVSSLNRNLFAVHSTSLSALRLRILGVPDVGVAEPKPKNSAVSRNQEVSILTVRGK
jgi:hypothetical protein